MKITKSTLFILAVAMLFLLAACSQGTAEKETGDTPATETPAATATPTETPDPPEESPVDDEDDEMTGDKVFTLEELARYNGKYGQPAYIAVDGIVYDVSDVPAWSGGKHQGFEPGQDVTDQIADISPHGKRVLDNLPKVGTLGN